MKETSNFAAETQIPQIGSILWTVHKFRASARNSMSHVELWALPISQQKQP